MRAYRFLVRVSVLTCLLSLSTGSIKSDRLTGVSWQVQTVVAETSEEAMARANSLVDAATDLVKSKNYSEALSSLYQARDIYHKLGRANDEGQVLLQIAILGSLGVSDADEFITNIEKAQELFKSSNNLAGQFACHYQMAQFFYSNENFLKVRIEFDSAKSVFRQGKESGLPTDLDNVSWEDLSFLQAILTSINAATYYSTGEYEIAEKNLEESITLVKENGWTTPFAYALLGNIYKYHRKDSVAARGYYEKAIQSLNSEYLPSYVTSQDAGLMRNSVAKLILPEIQKELGIPILASTQSKSLGSDPNFVLDLPLMQSVMLNSIGDSYYNEGNYSAALENYEKALGYARLVSSRGLERLTLGSIGDVMRVQDRPEAAIVFYKQSIELIEEIRQDLKSLTPTEQKTYVDSVESTYRNLISLLLQKQRILESQTVLDLLKGEEIFNYIKESRSTYRNGVIIYNPAENNVIQRYKSLTQFGQKVDECNSKKIDDCSNIVAQQIEMNEAYNKSLDAVKNIDSRQDESSGEIQDLLAKSKQIVGKPGTIFISAFVGREGILYLICVVSGVANVIEVDIPKPVSLSIGVPVKAEDLSGTVQEFRNLLKDKDSKNDAELKRVGNKLYEWIVKPVEKQFKDQEIKHLIFSLDRSLRYIPMSALFNGQEYLAKKYKISNVVKVSDTDVDPKPLVVNQENTLAFGVSEGYAGYPALPNVVNELEEISSHPILNSDFTLDSFVKQTNLGSSSPYSILHLATHAGTNLKQSSFLLGGGNPREFTSGDVGQKLFDTNNFKLVVLSACETGVGGIGDTNGVEVSALNYSFIRGRTRAKSVLASLWQVNDTSTSEFMSKFYKNLKSGENNSRVEALQKVQLDFLNDPRFSHPYYWAGFTLTGNSN